MNLAAQLIGKVVSAFGKNPLTIITATPTNYGAYIVNGHYVLTKVKALRLCDQPHRD